MKTCTVCQNPKNESDFYKRAASPDGLCYDCKECCKARVYSHREENIEYYREYDRIRAKLPHRVELRVKLCKEWRTEHPERYKANVILNNAIRSGSVIKKPCAECGREKVEAHHEDYSKPLEVIWLCKPHHFLADEARRKKESIA